eukprot:733955-Rhodomonas_salina.2
MHARSPQRAELTRAALLDVAEEPEHAVGRGQQDAHPALEDFAVDFLGAVEGCEDEGLGRQDAVGACGPAVLASSPLAAIWAASVGCDDDGGGGGGGDEGEEKTCGGRQKKQETAAPDVRQPELEVVEVVGLREQQQLLREVPLVLWR